MFQKLRNRIILITMIITTVVLVLAGVFTMVFASAMRPGPKPWVDHVSWNVNEANYDEQELMVFIESDRKDGNTRLLITLLSVGAIVEVVVFAIVYYLSAKIVEPVQDSYEKQKIFIANASHELKTPLAVIEANMEALEVGKDDQKWKDNIENEITHANKLVLDLLQLARMDAGNIKKGKSEKIDLKKEVEKRLEVFRPKFGGTILLKDIGASNDYELPRQDVLQVVDILLDNATKYGDKKIRVVLDEKGLSVANDGTIIKSEDQEKVFDRFYQADKTREGSGLGLAIAKAVCEQNGWDIKCEGSKKGTKFSVIW